MRHVFVYTLVWSPSKILISCYYQVFVSSPPALPPSPPPSQLLSTTPSSSTINLLVLFLIATLPTFSRTSYFLLQSPVPALLTILSRFLGLYRGGHFPKSFRQSAMTSNRIFLPPSAFNFLSVLPHRPYIPFPTLLSSSSTPEHVSLPYCVSPITDQRQPDPNPPLSSSFPTTLSSCLMSYLISKQCSLPIFLHR